MIAGMPLPSMEVLLIHDAVDCGWAFAATVIKRQMTADHCRLADHPFSKPAAAV